MWKLSKRTRQILAGDVKRKRKASREKQAPHKEKKKVSKGVYHTGSERVKKR